MTKAHGWSVRVLQAALIGALWIPLCPSSSVAQDTTELPAIVIENDRGGTLRDRIAQIRDIKRTGQTVRIEGRICYSTCTMFLGLQTACVSPDTVFGFHGPSSYGRPLNPVVFEQASLLIADHYPPAIKDWYIKQARHDLHRLLRVTGAHMIRLGVARC